MPVVACSLSAALTAVGTKRCNAGGNTGLGVMQR
jgi:hypothetical protein